MKDKKELRTGYTTGACSAAASKAAIEILLQRKNINHVQIPFPDGSRVNFIVYRHGSKGYGAWASIIKDAGDDPDITNGAEIIADVSIIKKEFNLNKKPEIIIKGGEGVGIVTKPGLPVSIGEPAINPVPQKMITEAVREVISCSEILVPAIEIKISVPNGKELAKKTLNPRLGIIGGISILGTTGIVYPLSDEAWTATIRASMDVAKAMGCEEIVLSSGRSSEKIHQERYGLPEDCYVMMGDHVQFSLLEAKYHCFKEVHLCAQWAKMIKIAMKIPQTHVRYGIAEFDHVSKFLSNLDNRAKNLLSQTHNYKFNTVREIFILLRNNLGYREQMDIFSKVCESAKQYAESITQSIPVKVYLAGYEGDLIAKVD